MVIWHFGERKIRKHKEVNDGQSFKIDSKCQREKHLQRRTTDAVLMQSPVFPFDLPIFPSSAVSSHAQLSLCHLEAIMETSFFLSTIFFLSLSCVSVCRCFNYLQSSSAEPITLPLHSSPLLSRACGVVSVCVQRQHI